MNDAPFILNPLGWVQIQLLGGWRRLGTTALFYGGLVLVINLLLLRALQSEGLSAANYAGGAFSILLALLFLFLLGGGANTIKRAVLRDFTTGMIASHRLTAMSGHTAVLGYLTGATAQMVTLSVVNWLACSLLAVVAGYPAYLTTLLMGPLVCLTAMLWSLEALLALGAQGKSAGAGLVVIVSIIVFTPASEYVPGVALLLGASTFSSLRIAGGSFVAPEIVLISMLAQMACALTFFIAAGRKFARDDVQAFTPQLGLAFLTLCALISALALRLQPSRWTVLGIPDENWVAWGVTTLGSIALVALLPVAAAAKAEARWARRRAKDPAGRPSRPRHYLLAPVLATLLVFGVFAAVLSPLLRQEILPGPPGEILAPIGWMVGFFLLSLVTVSAGLRFVYAASEKGLVFLIAYLLIVWLLPPIGDYALETVALPSTGEGPSFLLGCSPIGAWVVLFSQQEAPLLPGLILHIVLASGFLLLAGRAKY